MKNIPQLLLPLLITQRFIIADSQQSPYRSPDLYDIQVGGFLKNFNVSFDVLISGHLLCYNKLVLISERANVNVLLQPPSLRLMQ